ncbi:MAG: class I SAM-dependent methyltransferase, partial [Thermoanaerobaculia bacterium]
SSRLGMTQALYRGAVLRSLASMPHGRLTITMPDGASLSFGSGSNPRGAQHGLDAAITIRNPDFFRRCFFFGDIGFGESYVAGDWDTDDLEEVIAWFILNADESQAQSASRATKRILNWLGWLNNAAHRLRSNNESRSRENIAAHYDLSNEFFRVFLDPSMTYSAALFEPADATLDDAQIAKYDRLCGLLELKSGDRLLEIGGGWGAFSRYVAKKFGCHVTTITISRQQFEWASRLRAEERLESHIDLRLLDYRKLNGKFDKIISIEMLEAVGHRYYDAFFAKCAEVLSPNGLAALQVITCPEWRCETMRNGVDFIQKHIFPGGEVPSIGCMLESIHRVTDFTMRDLFDFGDSYARTLQLWAAKFEAGLDAIRAAGFDDSFIRKWRYYFRYCEAGFRMRHISVVQLLLSRSNNHTLASALI